MARDKGDGSLRKLPNGRWEGRYSYVDVHGVRHQPQFRAKTHAEAKQKLKKLIESVDEARELADNPQLVKPNNYLFSEWLDIWQDEILPNTVSPATIESYYRNIRTHIRPALGDLYLQQVRTVDIQTLLNKMRKDGLAPWTLNKVRYVISSAYKAAMEQTPPLVSANPCKGVKTPQVKQKAMRVFSEAEQLEVMNAIKGTRFETLYLFALATGMRKGEIVALTWDCVDFEKKQVHVRRSVNRVLDTKTGKTNLIEGGPKSESGFRRVPLLPNIIPALQAHKREQEAVQRKAGSAWNNRDLVFCSSVGDWIEPRRLSTELDKIIAANGFEHFGMHTFRHTYATRMLEKEVPPKVVSEILGHADVKTTLQIYSHVLDTTAHYQAEKLDGLFAGLTTDKKPEQGVADAHYPQFSGKNKRYPAKDKAKGKNKGGRTR